MDLDEEAAVPFTDISEEIVRKEQYIACEQFQVELDEISLG